MVVTVKVKINTSMYWASIPLLGLLLLPSRGWFGIGPRCVVAVSLAVNSSSSLFLLPVCESCIGEGSCMVVVEVVVTGASSV